MPKRPVGRRITRSTSTLSRRNSATRQSVRMLSGTAVRKAAQPPCTAIETATFNSPPPKVASNEPGIDCGNRRNPEGANRSITSPNVTTRMFSPLKDNVDCCLTLDPDRVGISAVLASTFDPATAGRLWTALNRLLFCLENLLRATRSPSFWFGNVLRASGQCGRSSFHGHSAHDPRHRFREKPEDDQRERRDCDNSQG